MDYDERSIRDFLKGQPDQFVSPRIINRRVGGKQRYLEDPQWATSVLSGMVEKGVLEMDTQGRVRLKKVDPIARANRTWLSPRIRRLLEQSSKDFSKVIKADIEEEDLA